MSCKDCEILQDIALDKNNPTTISIPYLRVGKSSIGILACPNCFKLLLNKMK